MSELKFNTDVVEEAPHDLDEAVEASGSKWTAASKAVTAVAGSVALASGVLLGNSYGIPGVVQAGQLLNLSGAQAAFAADGSGANGSNGSGVTGANGSGSGAGNGFGLSSYRKVKLTSGVVVNIPVSDPVPTGATVISEPILLASDGTNGSVVSTPVVTLPALPNFDAGNTSSATPGGGTVANPGSGSGSGNTSSATPSGGSGSGSYEDDDDDEREDHDEHEDHEDEDDD